MTTAACPDCGAASESDYCDACGAAMDALGSAGIDRASETVMLPASKRGEGIICPNPNCSRVCLPGDTFCVGCGGRLNSRLGRDGWAAVVTADWDFYCTMSDDQRAAVPFPEGLVPRDVALPNDETVVGRRDDDAAVHPDIDLSQPVTDWGVSRRHLILRHQAEGSLVMIDEGSANGTWLNDGPDRIDPGTPTALRDGDRIKLGYWTVIVVRYDGEVMP